MRVTGFGQLGKGTREQVVAGGPRGVWAVARPGRGVATAVAGTVDQIVVDQSRHVHELDRDARPVGGLRAGRGSKEDE